MIKGALKGLIIAKTHKSQYKIILIDVIINALLYLHWKYQLVEGGWFNYSICDYTVHFTMRVCIHTTTYVYTYYNICVYILQHICIHTTTYVYIYHNMCVYILQHMCIYTTTYLYTYYNIRVYILQHMCTLYILKNMCTHMYYNLYKCTLVRVTVSSQLVPTDKDHFINTLAKIGKKAKWPNFNLAFEKKCENSVSSWH